MLSSSACKVFIAIPSEELATSAESVAKELAAKYNVLDVTIRSSEAPSDRLLFSGVDPNGDDKDEMTGAMWVFYSGSSLAAAAIVQEGSPYPVLEVQALGEPQEIAWTIAKWCGLGCPLVSKRVHQAARERRQARLVQDAQLQTRSFKYQQAMGIVNDRNLQITGDNIGLESIRGKVRDRINVNETTIALVTTDRQSGFDRQLALVPYKGAVLNLTSAFWFEQTKNIIKNHIVAVPHPYVTIARKCQPFPIEFVVRYVMLWWCWFWHGSNGILFIVEAHIFRLSLLPPPSLIHFQLDFFSPTTPCPHAHTQVLFDWVDRHVNLEELSEWRSQLLRSRSTRRHGEESKTGVEFADTNHQGRRARQAHLRRRNYQGKVDDTRRLGGMC